MKKVNSFLANFQGFLPIHLNFPQNCNRLQFSKFAVILIFHLVNSFSVFDIFETGVKKICGCYQLFFHIGKT